MLFATALFTAAANCRETPAGQEMNTIPFNFHKARMDGQDELIVQHIEAIGPYPDPPGKEVPKTTFSDRLVSDGCIIFLLVLAGSTVLGLWTWMSLLFG